MRIFLLWTLDSVVGELVALKWKQQVRDPCAVQLGFRMQEVLSFVALATQINSSPLSWRDPSVRDGPRQAK
jgi:hypothetical protein